MARQKKRPGRDYRLPAEVEDRLLIGLALGEPRHKLVKDAGCSLAALYRRLDDPEYLARIQRIRDRLLYHIDGRVVQLVEEAVDKVAEIMRTAPQTSEQRQAAELLINLGFRKDTRQGRESSSEQTRVVPVLIDAAGAARPLLPGEIIESDVVSEDGECISK